MNLKELGFLIAILGLIVWHVLPQIPRGCLAINQRAMDHKFDAMRQEVRP